MGNTDDEGKGSYHTLTAKKEAEKIKGRLRGLYKSLEAHCDETTAQVNVTKKIKSDLHLGRLGDNFALCQTTMNKILADIETLSSLGEQEDSKLMKDHDVWYNKYKVVSEAVKDAEVEVAEARLVAPRPLAAAAFDGGSRKPQLPKANDLLRPKELQLDDKPSILRLWKREFQDFYESNSMNEHTFRVQQTYFLQCISPMLRNKVKYMVNDTTPILTVPSKPDEEEQDSCFKALDTIFKAQYPMVRRRQDFFDYMQSPGQKTSEYLVKLRDLFDEAEMQHGFDPMDLLTYKAIQGCTYKTIQTKFNEEEEPTFQKLEKLALNIERSENQVKSPHALTNQAEAHADKVGGNTKSTKGGKNNCKRCNRSGHNHTNCGYKDKTCHDCGKKGHIKFSPWCKGKPQQATSDDEEVAAKSVRVVTCNVVSAAHKPHSGLKDGPKPLAKSRTKGKDGPKPLDPAKKRKKTVKVTEVDSKGLVPQDKSNVPTPRMEVQVSQRKGGPLASSKALPDTGCTQTIMSLKMAKGLKVKIDPKGSVPIIAADGKYMMCEGSAKIHIHHEGLEIETKALVSSVLKDEILISWHDLVKLEIVSQNFPHRTLVSQANLVRSTYQQAKDDLRDTVLKSENSIQAFTNWLSQTDNSDTATAAVLSMDTSTKSSTNQMLRSVFMKSPAPTN